MRWKRTKTGRSRRHERSVHLRAERYWRKYGYLTEANRIWRKWKAAQIALKSSGDS